MVGVIAARHPVNFDQDGVWDAESVLSSKLNRSCELLQENFLRRDSFGLAGSQSLITAVTF